MTRKLVAGIDYGSDSVRVVLADAKTGDTVADAVTAYPRWQEGLYCDPKEVRYRQHPLDYIESLMETMAKALAKAGRYAGRDVIGLAFDTTGSTPCPVDREGTPLALLPEFAENPHAMFHLWKDHTAVAEAKEINEAFQSAEVDYTKYQGIYSSEWYWAKILHTTRVAPEIREAAYMWVEHCDYMAGLLTGRTAPSELVHCSCAAGHKALWHSAFGGLPARSCLAGLDPYLGDIYDRYGSVPVPAGSVVGKITPEWAKRLSLNPDAVIGVGSFDAHAGAVGAGVARKTMVKVVGTSTVDMLVEHPKVLSGKDLRAYCGQAEDSIVPGYVGLEMSQPAFGDAYAWFRKLVNWSVQNIEVPDEIVSKEQQKKLAAYLEEQTLVKLEQEANKHLEDDLIALDWFNGRRYPNLNESVKAAISGLDLGSRAPAIYAAIVKGTVFGSKRIYESLLDNGLQIERLIAVGGIAKKSKMVMQMMADALNISIMVCKEDQVCAKGAAIYAAVAAGVYDKVEEAQQSYCEIYWANYFPDPKKHKMYEEMYERYLALGAFAEDRE